MLRLVQHDRFTSVDAFLSRFLITLVALRIFFLHNATTSVALRNFFLRNATTSVALRNFFLRNATGQLGSNGEPGPRTGWHSRQVWLAP